MSSGIVTIHAAITSVETGWSEQDTVLLENVSKHPLIGVSSVCCEVTFTGVVGHVVLKEALALDVEIPDDFLKYSLMHV